MALFLEINMDNDKMLTNGKYVKSKKSIKQEGSKRAFPLISGQV